MLRRLLNDDNLQSATLIVAFFAVVGYLAGLLWSFAHAAVSGVAGAGIGLVIVFLFIRFSSERNKP